MWSTASLMVLGAWAGLALTFAGFGFLFCRAFRQRPAGADGWFLAFWLGWVATLFLLQVWHFFLPVDARALAVVGAAGLVGIVVAVAAPGRRSLRELVRGLARQWPALVALGLVTVGLSYRALNGPQHGDSGAYFIPTVRWLVAYPVVRGLANLFVPYAFNQSYFLYVAMLDVGPFARGSFHLANGLLILAFLARAILGLHRLVRWPRPCAPADVFYALFLPVAVQLGMGIFLTSPSPDLAIFVLGVVVSGQLITHLSRPDARAAAALDVLAIALLAAGGVTVKLSFVGLATAVISLALLTATLRARRGFGGGVRLAIAAGIVMAAGMVPWLIRNVFQSGCPLYPSAVGALPVEWRVQADAVEWVKAPMHFGAYPWFVFRDPRWFYTRLDSLGWIANDIVVPSGIAVAAMLAALVAGAVRLLRRRAPARPRLPVSILVPAAASFVFVTWTAPMPRYMGATFWLLAVQSVLLLLGRAAFGEGKRRRLVTGAVLITASVVVVVLHRPVLGDVTDFLGAPVPRLTEQSFASGLQVGIPEYSQCWDAPLPCSPAPSPGLRLRRPGDLGSGFLADPPPPKSSADSGGTAAQGAE